LGGNTTKTQTEVQLKKKRTKRVCREGLLNLEPNRTSQGNKHRGSKKAGQWVTLKAAGERQGFSRRARSLARKAEGFSAPPGERGKEKILKNSKGDSEKRKACELGRKPVPS